jgi:hypothetical protein
LLSEYAGGSVESVSTRTKNPLRRVFGFCGALKFAGEKRRWRDSVAVVVFIIVKSQATRVYD